MYWEARYLVQSLRVACPEQLHDLGMEDLLAQAEDVLHEAYGLDLRDAICSTN
jgi:hypothetical protein